MQNKYVYFVTICYVNQDYKAKYLIENINTLKINMVCFADETGETLLYTDDDYYKNENPVDYVGKELEKLGSKHVNFDDLILLRSFESEQYKTAAEMFIYLTLCPKFKFDWKVLYVDLFQNAPPNVIVETLNRIMITGRKKNDLAIVDITKGILEKVESKLSLKFQEIDEYFKGSKIEINNVENSILPKNLSYKANDVTVKNLTSKFKEIELNIQGNLYQF